MKPLCELEGRCLWHVPHTVRYLLYKDGIKGDDNKELTRQLAKMVFDERGVPRQREEKLMKWVRRNHETAPHSTTHVQKARRGIRNVEEHPELFDVQTTSPMERRMVELNKRFENGGGWTKKGARALLWHHELGVLEPEKWLDEVRPNDGPELPEFFQNSLI